MGDQMSEIRVTDEYQNMSSNDQKSFRRWLVGNAIVQVLAICALIAAASVFSERNAASVTAASSGSTVHAEAR
jgi:hypothetical protein